MANRTKRTQEKDARFFNGLRAGLSVTAAAAQAPYKRRTLYEWREADDEFRAEWDAALEEGTDLLEDEALRRAMHGNDRPVFHQGEQCGVVREYSDTLTIFLLKARRPEKYRDNVSINHGIEPKSPLAGLLQQIAGSALKPTEDNDDDK